MTLPPTPRPPHPYARRHLAAHAAAAGKLDDDILNLETLPYLDEARLSSLLRLTEPPPQSRQWLLLSAWRTIRHRWSWDDPDANAAALDVAQLAVDPTAPLPDRWTASGLTWKPRLVQWQAGGTIVAGDQRGGLRLTIGTVQGVPILVTGNAWSVRVWDPATGQPIGEPLHAPYTIRALTLAEGPGLVLAACDGGHVMAWDAVTHLPSATIEISDLHPTALAVGEVEDRWIVAAGGARLVQGSVSGVVQVRWLDSGELLHEFRDNKNVQAVALAKNSNGRLHLAIGYGYDLDAAGYWLGGSIAVHDAVSEEPCNPGIAVPGEISDIALALVEDELVVAAGALDGSAGAWNTLSGTPVSPPVRHDGEVSSVALATIGGSHLLATGCSDRTARLWYLPGSVPAGPPLSHPAPVESLAFGEVEGRTMLVTGCLDGNTRLWDPLRSSAARVAVEGWFTSVATDADVVVAGGEHGHVRLWDIASGNSYPPLSVKMGRDLPAELKYELPEDPTLVHTYPAAGHPPPGVKVQLGGIHPRILIAEDLAGVGIWDVSDPSEPVLRTQIDLHMGTLPFDVHVAKGFPLLATLNEEIEVMVFDLLARTRLFRIGIDGADSVRFIDAPGYPLLGVWAHDEVYLLDIESGKPNRLIRTDLPVSLPHVAVGRLDGADVLAVLDTDGLRLYDLRTGKLTIPPVEMSSTANGIAWGRVADRDVVVTAHFATVRAWNPRTGRKITELRFGTQIGAMSVRQTGDGRLLVAVSGPGLVLTELREIAS